MIRTKQDLGEYLKCDQIALRQGGRRKPRFGRDEIWRFEILLRKAEYYTNCPKSHFYFGQNILKRSKRRTL